MFASAATTADVGLARQLSDARAQLADQEREIRELNHRVANSLQLAADMLVFEQLRTRDPFARAALEASRARLIAVGELHRYLSDNAGASKVALGPFLDGLCRAVAAATGLCCSAVSDDTSVPGNMAQQLAIAINEFAVNAAKHAYGGQPNGRLFVTSRRYGSDLVLSVADEGKGLGAGLANGGLGMSIVTAIVRGLGATLTATSEAGAKFTIRAPIPAPAQVDRSFQTWTQD